MNKTVLVASDEMRLCNVLKAIKDLEQILLTYTKLTGLIMG